MEPQVETSRPKAGSSEAFARTSCACSLCLSFCHEKPGVLIPGDLTRIASHLVEQGRVATVDDAKPMFRASPGAVVLYQGELYSIPSITPARKANGACVFLDGARCTIWEVSPFGCSHFDAHMGEAEGQRRSEFVHRAIAGSASYAAARRELAPAGRR